MGGGCFATVLTSRKAGGEALLLEIEMGCKETDCLLKLLRGRFVAGEPVWDGLQL